jgi:hypothetical protein
MDRDTLFAERPISMRLKRFDGRMPMANAWRMMYRATSYVSTKFDEPSPNGDRLYPWMKKYGDCETPTWYCSRLPRLV